MVPTSKWSCRNPRSSIPVHRRGVSDHPPGPQHDIGRWSWKPWESPGVLATKKLEVHGMISTQKSWNSTTHIGKLCETEEEIHKKNDGRVHGMSTYWEIFWDNGVYVNWWLKQQFHGAMNQQGWEYRGDISWCNDKTWQNQLDMTQHDMWMCLKLQYAPI